MSLFSRLTHVALLAALGACTAETATPNDVGTTKEAAATEAATTAKTRLGPGAPLLTAALREPINLTADQRAKIEGILAHLPDAPFPGVPSIVAMARSTETDPARLQAIGEEAAREATRPVAASIKALHDTLTKEQRSALVAAMAAAKPGDHAFLQRHVVVARDKALAAHAGDGHAAPPPEKAEELHVKMIANHRVRLQSFVEDDFDASAFLAPKVDFGPFVAKLAQMPPERRAKIAAHLEERMRSPGAMHVMEIKELHGDDTGPVHEPPVVAPRPVE